MIIQQTLMFQCAFLWNKVVFIITISVITIIIIISEGGQRLSVMVATHFSAPCFVLICALFLHYKITHTAISCPRVIIVTNGLKSSDICSLSSLKEEALARHSIQ